MIGFEIVIASLPEKERLVAEVYYNNMYWARISQEIENSDHVVEFFAHPQKNCWEFKYLEALIALQNAKAKLDSMGEDKRKLDQL